MHTGNWFQKSESGTALVRRQFAPILDEVIARIIRRSSNLGGRRANG